MIRRLIAEVTGRDDVLRLARDTPLFGPVIGLDSLAGAELLARIADELGVDIAAEDLELASLRTIATLEDFVASRTRRPRDAVRPW